MKTITIEIPDGKKAEWVNGVLTLVDDKPQEPNEQIKSFDDAVRSLGINELDNEEEICYANKHPASILYDDDDIIRKINAYAKLLTIATAWNKIDGFEPDWEDTSQNKCFAWFEHSTDTSEFVCRGVRVTAEFATAFYGAGLCFSTEQRAEQFGKQFIDLWNEFLK